MVEKLRRLHPAGEELRIAWLDRRGLRTLHALEEAAS